MKLPRSRPCSSSSASHSASSTSVLRPGRIFTWWALTSSNSQDGCSSSRYQTGFQYDPVASITTAVTSSAANHSTMASSEAEGRERAGLPDPPPTTRLRGAHARDDLVLADIDARTALDQRVHQRPPRPHPDRVEAGRANRSTTL